MRIHRGFLGWGIFLILAGSIPLAVRAGYLSDVQLRDVWNLWPLILVGIGVGLLLSRTRYGFLGGFIVAATFGVIVGGVLAGSVGGIDLGCGSARGTTAFASREGPLSEASASVEIEFSCGDLTVAAAPGNTWRIEGEDRDGTGPNLNADNASLHLWTRNSNGNPFDALNDRGTWRVTLPDAPRLDTTLTLNAGSSTVNLAGANLGRFATTLNAGSTVINLGAVRQISSLDVEVNAGSITLTLPNLSISGSFEVNAGSVDALRRAGRRRPDPDGREHHRQLRLPGPEQERLDLADARLRQRGGKDRSQRECQCRLRQPRSERRGLRWLSRSIDRVTIGCWPASRPALPRRSTPTHRSSASCGPCSRS